MYIYYNPNPTGRKVGDCAIRAISKALNISWDEAYARICAEGFVLCDMPSSDAVWGSVLISKGFNREVVRSGCEDCYTTEMFCRDHPEGTFVIAYGGHVATVVDGNLFDSWDSSVEIPVYYYTKEENHGV